MSNKDLEQIGHEFCEGFTWLTDDNGRYVMDWMVQAAIQSGITSFYLLPHELHIWPAPFRIDQCEDVVENYLDRFSFVIRSNGFLNRDLGGLIADFHIDLGGLMLDQGSKIVVNIPYRAEMIIEDKSQISHCVCDDYSIDMVLTADQILRIENNTWPGSWSPSLPLFEQRRKNFFRDSYYDHYPYDGVDESLELPRYTCPVCGFPTLHGRQDYDQCRVCLWEDEGFDDGNGLYALSGPNGLTIVAEARLNFDLYGNAFPPYEVGYEDDITVASSPIELEYKRKLVNSYLALPKPLKYWPDKWKSKWKVCLQHEEALYRCLRGET